MKSVAVNALVLLVYAFALTGCGGGSNSVSKTSVPVSQGNNAVVAGTGDSTIPNLPVIPAPVYAISPTELEYAYPASPAPASVQYTTNIPGPVTWSVGLSPNYPTVQPLGQINFNGLFITTAGGFSLGAHQVFESIITATSTTNPSITASTAIVFHGG